MGFSSVIYIFIFFPMAIMGYFLMEKISHIFEKRNKLNISEFLKKISLIGISLVFYAWTGVSELWLILIVIAFLWIMGIAVEKIDQSKKKKVLILSIFILTGLLIYFHYSEFIINNFNRFLRTEFTVKSLTAPVGLSFIIFSAISYVADIYSGKATSGSIIDAYLYILFFPKILSGPIVKWQDFQLQIRNKFKIATVEEIVGCINRIAIGLAKKAILADTFAATINQISSISEIDAPTAWMSAILFTFQIYYDFSGYSDIAIGTAGIFGLKFDNNFDFPYTSKSISEFWRRWHISLGMWFREYIYIPLGGNRKGITITLRNLFLVFLLTGVWHGPTWNYIVWGGLNGCFIVLERLIRDKKIYKMIPSAIKMITTFLIIFFSWQFFRFSTMGESITFISNMFGSYDESEVYYMFEYYINDNRLIAFLFIAVIGAFIGIFKQTISGYKELVGKSNIVYCLQEFAIISLFFIAVLFVINSTYSPFLYFRY